MLALRAHRGKLIAITLSGVALPLFWAGAQPSRWRDLATFLAIGFVLLALRFLHWDYARRRREPQFRAAAAPTPLTGDHLRAAGVPGGNSTVTSEKTTVTSAASS